MIYKKIKKIVSTILCATFLAGILSIPVFASQNTPISVKHDSTSNIAISLGNDLSQSQKESMLNEFGVSKSDENVNIINITVDDIREQLGLGKTSSTSSKNNSYSSSYVKLKESGYGIKVSTNNLTEVTGTMLQNALLTSGVTDADVKASSPFPVTGTAALAGILKGFEDATGTELSLNQKEVAKEEINVTNTLSNALKNDGETLGKDEAALVISEIKTQVIKDSPKTDIAIDRIVTNIVNNYNINLTPDQKSDIVSLMSDINDLDFNYSQMKTSLKQITNSIKNSLNEAGKELKESGVIEKSLNKIKDFSGIALEKISTIITKVKNSLTNNNEDVIIEKDGVKYDLDGKIISSNENDDTKSSNENYIDAKIE